MDSIENPAQEVVEHLQSQIRQTCSLVDFKKNDEDIARKYLFSLSKCHGWDMKKVEEWFKSEFPHLMGESVWSS